MAQPEIRQANPAGEPDFAINDQELAMVAMIDPRQIIPNQRIIAPDLNSSLLHEV